MPYLMNPFSGKFDYYESGATNNGVTPVASFSDLPVSGTAGQTYMTEDSGVVYAWSTINSAWLNQASSSGFTPTQCGVFNGTSAFITTTTGLNTGWHTPFTISFWAKISSTTGYRSVWDSYTIHDNKGVQLYFIPGSRRLEVTLYCANDTALSLNTNSDIAAANTWVFVTVTYDGSAAVAGIKVYVNASLVATTSDGGATISQDFLSSTATILGAYDGGSGHFFNGKLAQIALFPLVLSGSSVGSLYDGGQLLNIGQFGSAPTAWYQLNNNVIDTQNFANGTNTAVTFTTDLPPTDSSAPSYASRYLANLTSPVAINKDLTFLTDGTYNIGDSAGTARPKNLYLAGSMKGAEGSEGNCLIIGSQPLANTHYYPIHVSINDSVGIQNWLINETAATYQSYAAWFAGYDKITKYTAFGSVPDAYLNGANPPVGTPQGFLASSCSLGLTIAADANAPVRIATNGLYRFEVTGGGHLRPVTDVTYDIGDATHAIRDLWPQNIKFKTMTNAAMHAIGSPVEGQIVYDSDNHIVCYYNGSGWRQLSNTAAP